VQAVAVSRLGDTWRLGRHRLTCGDCTDAGVVEAALAGAKPHLMVTDPPYGVDYDPAWREEAARKGLIGFSPSALGAVTNDGRLDWSEAWTLFSGNVAYVWHADRFASAVQASVESAGFEIRCQIIWAKTSFAISRGHYNWQHEPCWYAVRKGETGHWHGSKSETTLWNIAREQDRETGHSTQKPVECMRRPIENNSAPGDAVYDPFLGSGTTIIACEQTGRACVAIEISAQYCDVAVIRWQNFSGGIATLASDGRTFAEVAAERVPQLVAA
jgi:DNA modification methylase